MGPYFIHYIHPTGTRLTDVSSRSFHDLAAARAEALRILEDLRTDSVEALGVMQICDAAGIALAEIHFPTKDLQSG